MTSCWTKAQSLNLWFHDRLNCHLFPVKIILTTVKGQTLSFWTEPESVPVSGEQCKHPGLSSACQSRPHKAPSLNPSQHIPLCRSKTTTSPSLSANDWWYTGISFMTALCFGVTVTTRWKQSISGVLSFPTLIAGEEVRGKKERQQLRGHCRSQTNSHHCYLKDKH